MFRSDYHIHSKFSGDSSEELERIINRAKELGLQEIAITDHMDLDAKDGSNNNDFKLDLDIYIPTLQQLKEINKKEIDIKIGMEFGIQKHLIELEAEIEKKYPFDFIINSVHTVDGLLLDKENFWRGKTREEAQEKYFLEILNNVQSTDKFSVVGHLDFISRYGGVGKKGFIDYILYQEVIDEIFKVLISKNKGIEINTSGIRYLENRFYPCDDLVKRYFQLGGEIVTVGSDSHKASDIGKDFKKAYDFLESIGVKYISSFDKMEVSFKKIK